MFTDVNLKENRIGEDGFGFNFAMAGFKRRAWYCLALDSNWSL
jgi:hypothetical protein